MYDIAEPTGLSTLNFDRTTNQLHAEGMWNNQLVTGENETNSQSTKSEVKSSSQNEEESIANQRT